MCAKEKQATLKAAFVFLAPLMSKQSAMCSYDIICTEQSSAPTHIASSGARISCDVLL
jgi:hypothetical protein